MTKRFWFSQQKFSKVIDDQVREYTSLGGNVFYGLVFLFVFAVGYTQKSEIMIRTSQVLLVSGVLFTIIGFWLKYMVSRTRPSKESLRWDSILEKMNDASFPSIHSGRAIILAYTISPLLPGLGQTLFYFAMLGVPVSRVWLKKHYWSDVIAGLLIGFIVVYWVDLLI